ATTPGTATTRRHDPAPRPGAKARRQVPPGCCTTTAHRHDAAPQLGPPPHRHLPSTTPPPTPDARSPPPAAPRRRDPRPRPAVAHAVSSVRHRRPDAVRLPRAAAATGDHDLQLRAARHGPVACPDLGGTRPDTKASSPPARTTVT